MNVDKSIWDDLNTFMESSSKDSIVLVCSVKTVDEWKCWLSQFSAATNTARMYVNRFQT